MDPNTPAGADAPKPAGEASTTPATTAAAVSDEPLLNKKEIVELRKETRETRDLVKQFLAKVDGALPAASPATTSASKSDTPTDDIKALRAEMAFKEAVADIGIPLTRDQRQKLWKLHQAESPPDVGAWLNETVAAFGMKPGAATAPTTPAQSATTPPIASSNGGAPVAKGGEEQISKNPFEWPLSYAQKVGAKAFREAWNAYKNDRGGHPYAEFHAQRRGAQSGNALDTLASSLAEKIKRG